MPDSNGFSPMAPRLLQLVAHTSSSPQELAKMIEQRHVPDHRRPYLAIASGNNQNAIVNNAFAVQLAVIVTTPQGQPVSGALVTFTLPASGASGAFAGGATSVVVATNAQGIAIAPLLTANGIAGTFTVTASTPGEHDGLPATFTLTNLAAGL